MVEFEKNYNEGCDLHPEWTSKQRECYRYQLLAGKVCDVTDERITQKTKHNDFVIKNPTLVGFSEKTVRSLRGEKDPEIQQKVISQIEKARPQEKERLYGTERKMKAAIARFKYIEPEKPTEPKPKKLWGKVEQAEYAQEVVRTFIANGVNPAVIRELIVKAIEVVGQE